MNDYLMFFIAIAIIAISSFMMYIYFGNRRKEEFIRKEIFKVGLIKKLLIASVVIGILACIVFFISFLYKNDNYITSLMNSITFILLIMMGYIDYKEKIIPNKLVLVGFGLWIILSVLEILVVHTPIKSLLLYSLLGAGVCGGILLIVATVSKSALGMGDVKMFAMIGLLYGLTDTYSILLYSLFVMAIVSIVLLIAKKVTRKTAIPMAPFVVVGFLINVLFGV